MISFFIFISGIMLSVGLEIIGSTIIFLSYQEYSQGNIIFPIIISNITITYTILNIVILFFIGIGLSLFGIKLFLYTEKCYRENIRQGAQKGFSYFFIQTILQGLSFLIMYTIMTEIIDSGILIKYITVNIDIQVHIIVGILIFCFMGIRIGFYKKYRKGRKLI